jgi:hypothetical protein
VPFRWAGSTGVFYFCWHFFRFSWLCLVAMPDSLAPVFADDAVNPEALLHTLLAISLTGVMLLRPVYGADGTTVVDLVLVQLNPAAQQMLRLPERPPSRF